VSTTPSSSEPGSIELRDRTARTLGDVANAKVALGDAGQAFLDELAHLEAHVQSSLELLHQRLERLERPLER
jgi:hypothetical protein